jgi:hypothetical protein
MVAGLEGVEEDIARHCRFFRTDVVYTIAKPPQEKLMLEKPAVTQIAIADLLARRWSPRAIDPERSVSREHLLALLEAARWAPSCFGDQPWRYLVWDRFRDAAGWRCLQRAHRRWHIQRPRVPAHGQRRHPVRT